MRTRLPLPWDWNRRVTYYKRPECRPEPAPRSVSDPAEVGPGWSVREGQDINLLDSTNNMILRVNNR